MKMESFIKFLKICFIILFLTCNYSLSLKSERNVEIVEELILSTDTLKSLINTLVSKSNELLDVCSFEKSEKMAICEIIFQQDHYTSLGIHLGKTAIFYHTAECQKKLITFRHNETKNDLLMQTRMFPCYGSHNPIRTNWNIDDFFDAFYVSQDPKSNSLFVYASERTTIPSFYSIISVHIFENNYIPIEYISDIELIHILPVLVTHEDVIEELKGRKFITFNRDRKENEINYIREITDDKLHSNFICNLEIKTKIQLCRKILDRDPHREYFTVIEEIMLTDSVECDYKKCSTQNFNNGIMDHRMYPCYGYSTAEEQGTSEIESAIYLAEGYRDNSVLVFIENPINPSEYNILEFVENVFLRLCHETMHTQTDIRKNEKIYIEKIVWSEIKPDTLCDLPKEQKLGICEAVILQSDINSNEIFFNKSAAFYSTPDCIETLISFSYDNDLNDNKPKQKLFPCYARGNPIRTGWNVDERFDMYFISGGPENDSLILYKKYKEVRDDYYKINEIMWDVGIENVFSVTVTQDEVDKELELLQIVSCNYIKYEIETALLREIILYERQIPDAICNLENEMKLLLCKIIMNQCYEDSLNTIEVVENYEIIECEEKFIHFQVEIDTTDVKVKVFPCPMKIIARINTEENNNSRNNPDSGDDYGDEIQSELSNIERAAVYSHSDIQQGERNEESVLPQRNNEDLQQPEFPRLLSREIRDIGFNSRNTDAIKLYYLSSGYRPNSVILYKENITENNGESSQNTPSSGTDDEIKADTNIDDKILILNFIENLNFLN